MAIKNRMIKEKEIVKLKNKLMKTIEEAAKEYMSRSAGCRYDIAFKAGVEFTQKWISVNEELPDKYKKVLIKIALLDCTKENEFDFSIAMIAHNGEWDVFFGKNRPITHWRHIELR